MTSRLLAYPAALVWCAFNGLLILACLALIGWRELRGQRDDVLASAAFVAALPVGAWVLGLAALGQGRY